MAGRGQAVGRGGGGSYLTSRAEVIVLAGLTPRRRLSKVGRAPAPHVARPAARRLARRDGPSVHQTADQLQSDDFTKGVVSSLAMPVAGTPTFLSTNSRVSVRKCSASTSS